MKLEEADRPDGTVRVENVGGIDETSVGFSPGLTVLVGRNATNRTSLLRAIMAALGSDDVTVKGDADEGFVELELGDERYTRRLRRRSGTVVTDGDPYLEDPELADLFAFLLEANEARRAVAGGDDLRELIMRPVDTDEIAAEIDRLREEREALERELDELADLEDDLPALERERTRLRERIEEKRADLRAKEEELESADADVEETREETAELEDTFEELRAKRSRLDDVRYDLETERETLEHLQEERRELESKREVLPEAPAGEVDEIESRIAQLRERRQTLETEVSELQNVIGFNEELLEDAGSGTFAAAGEDADSEGVTDELVNDEVTCWTCGSAVAAEQIERTIGNLRELNRKKLGEVNDLRDDLDELNAERQDIEDSRRERSRIERRLGELDEELETTEETIERLRSRREELTEEIESVEAAVEELERGDDSAILDLHREANQLEYELGALENDLERVDDEVESIERRLDERSDVEDQLAEVETRIEELRTRIERIESEAIDQFNEQMDTVLEILDYGNLERIWLERVESRVREGRRTVTRSVFELHVIRTTASGTAYEDTVEHLSESEREVTGLVFALAGYLAHELYEDLPFVLLDSLEAIDSDRIAALIDHLDAHTGYLIVALLPEDADALSREHRRITEI